MVKIKYKITHSESLLLSFGEINEDNFLLVLFSKGIYNVAKYFKYTFYIIKYHLTSASSIICCKYSYQAKV